MLTEREKKFCRMYVRSGYELHATAQRVGVGVGILDRADIQTYIGDLITERLMPYDQSACDYICDQVAQGDTLKKIFNSGAPELRGVTVSQFYYMRRDYEELERALEAAEAMRARTFMDSNLDIADDDADDWTLNEKTGRYDFNPGSVARSRLKIDVRWRILEAINPAMRNNAPALPAPAVTVNVAVLASRANPHEAMRAYMELMRSDAPALSHQLEEPGLRTDIGIQSGEIIEASR